MDQKDHRRVILWGSLIPFFFYVIWLFVSYPPQTFSNLGDFINFLSTQTGAPFLGAFFKIFTIVSLMTSFLGVSIGLYHMASVHFPTSPLLLTFLPPIFCVFVFKNSFLVALSWAGMALTLLAILFPSMIFIKRHGWNLSAAVLLGCGLFMVLITCPLLG